MSAASSGGVRLVGDPVQPRIVLDRPPLNVLDLEGLEELERILEDVAASRDTRVVCLTGTGKAFCAGVSVEDHLPGRCDDAIRTFGRVVRRLLELPTPVVAAVNGHALGGGCELAAACDLVLAREGARLGQPEIRLGVFPPAACSLLPRQLGRQRALDLVLTGRKLEVEEAFAVGLVQRVFPEEEFEASVDSLLDRIAALSGPVLRLTKRAVREGAERSAAEGLAAAERIYLEELMELGDPVEGLEAFLEKREPVWRHA